jgi:hypothetical protein
VLDSEVAEAMESMQRVPRKVPRKAS